MTDAKLTKAERLAIATYSAPHLRGSPGRQVKVIGANGSVVREISSTELAKQLHQKASIEFDVEPDAAPILRDCSKCGRPFTVPPKRGQRRKCERCRTHKPKPEGWRERTVPVEQHVCAGWDGPCPTNEVPPRSALMPNRVEGRNGAPWRCRTCGGHKAVAGASERLSRAGRAGWKDAEQRSERSRKIHAAQTPEQRSERQRKAAQTTKQRKTPTLGITERKS